MLVQSKEKPGVSYRLLDVAWLLFEYDKKSHYYDTGQPLFEAEIHLIVAIQDNPGFHVAALANKFGVTKGAISQLVQKLERKGMVIKERAADNQSKILLNLTETGMVAYAAHTRFHMRFDAMIDRLLEGESEEHITFLERFLGRLAQEIGSFDG